MPEQNQKKLSKLQQIGLGAAVIIFTVGVLAGAVVLAVLNVCG